MLNRHQPPAFKTINRINVIRAQHEKLDNGIDFYSLSAGSQEITRIEFIFRAGMYHQPATLIASTTNSMLESGTRLFTADQLSDGIDFYGSFLELQVEQDFATITLFSLNKYLEESLAFIEEILKFPTFPEHEFKIHVSNKKQKHAINSQKVNVVVRRKFAGLLFGNDHPYGVEVKEEDFERVNIGELRAFFNAHYAYGNCTIIAAGNLPSQLRSLLNNVLGKDKWGNELKNTGAVNSKINTTKEQQHLVLKDDTIQSAIRIGRLLFNKTHPDYFKFQVLNSVLGGYFGSRLMANIREDKGYTYGIGSGINNLVNGGFFYIATEVGSDVTADTLKEIYKEIGLLREKPVDKEELETVRNYMLGNFLRSVDGPFALADKFKAIWEYGLDYSFFEKYFDAVKTVSPKELQDLANKYLQEKDLIECVAGKIN